MITIPSNMLAVAKASARDSEDQSSLSEKFANSVRVRTVPGRPGVAEIAASDAFGLLAGRWRYAPPGDPVTPIDSVFRASDVLLAWKARPRKAAGRAPLAGYAKVIPSEGDCACMSFSGGCSPATEGRRPVAEWSRLIDKAISLAAARTGRLVPPNCCSMALTLGRVATAVWYALEGVQDGGQLVLTGAATDDLHGLTGRAFGLDGHEFLTYNCSSSFIGTKNIELSLFGDTDLS